MSVNVDPLLLQMGHDDLLLQFDLKVLRCRGNLESRSFRFFFFQVASLVANRYFDIYWMSVKG